MSRRLLAVVPLVVLLLAALAACTSTAPAPPPTSSTRSAAVTGAVPVPVAGAYFGTHFGGSDEARRTAIASLEAQLGRRFAIDHVYYRWQETFPGDYDRWTIDQGRLLFLNWTSRSVTGPPVKWKDIADGQQDSVIDARAKAVAALGVPVLMGFTHEPGSLVGSGQSKSGLQEDYIAAWRHIVQRFRSDGVSNVSWVWTLTSFQFRSGDVTGLYPGDDIVDWVGADGYANISCPWLKTGWTPFTDIFSAAADFARSHVKPFIVAEFNAGEDRSDAGRKAKWLEDAAAAVARDDTIKAVVSFNSQESCAAIVGSSADTVAGYASMGRASSLAVPAPDATSTPTASTAQ